MEVSIAEEQTNVNSNDAVILDNKDLSTSIFQGAILASQLPYKTHTIGSFFLEREASRRC